MKRKEKEKETKRKEKETKRKEKKEKKREESKKQSDEKWTYSFIISDKLGLILLLWIIWIINNVIIILSHFLPIGIEGLLKLFIPVLEIIGVIIRPITLAIRLATNISCGHVVLLIFRFFAFNVANYLVISIRILLFGLYFIEFLVCAIQAYVFWRLIYIYIIEIEI